jgi:serine/threonine-protein kinase RsbW
MAVERRLSIPAVLEKVPEACQFVVNAAEYAGLDEKAVYYCQMAVDEWCTNIIEHGFDYKGERHKIDIQCLGKPNYLQIIVVDDSPPFDPTTLADVDPSQLLEDRQPGGLGWFFIRKIMDEVHYAFKDGRNELTMIKQGAQPDAVPGQPGFPAAELRNGIWIITPSGRLDATAGRLLEQALAAQLEAAHIRLIVDMRNVSYISSGGLKALVATWKKAKKLGGNLALAGLSPRVFKVFELSGFDALFPIFENPEASVAIFEPS